MFVFILLLFIRSRRMEEDPNGLRRCNKNQKVLDLNPTRGSVGLRDSMSLRGFGWLLGQNCRNAVIKIGWVRLSLDNGPKLGVGKPGRFFLKKKKKFWLISLCSFQLKVQSCKLYNNKYMVASTEMTNTEIFLITAVLVFKLFNLKVLFINRKDKKLLKSRLLFRKISIFTG